MSSTELNLDDIESAAKEALWSDDLEPCHFVVSSPQTVLAMIARIRELEKNEYTYKLELIGIEPGDECGTCGGVGRRLYGCNQTWRVKDGWGSPTVTVCEKCWGSGSKSKTGQDLRVYDAKLAASEKRAEAWRYAANLGRHHDYCTSNTYSDRQVTCNCGLGSARHKASKLEAKKDKE